jgi:hypothetical protein
MVSHAVVERVAEQLLRAGVATACGAFRRRSAEQVAERFRQP